MNICPIAYRFFSISLVSSTYSFLSFSTHPWEADGIFSQFWQLFSSENLILEVLAFIWLLLKSTMSDPLKTRD